jgi:hypothetical protein
MAADVFAPLEPEDLATLSRLLDKILRAQAPENT